MPQTHLAFFPSSWNEQVNIDSYWKRDIFTILLAKHVRSGWLNISLVLFSPFMDLDFVSVHKKSKKIKKELGQYPASLTSRFISNVHESGFVFIPVKTVGNDVNTSLVGVHELQYWSRIFYFGANDKALYNYLRFISFLCRVIILLRSYFSTRQNTNFRKYYTRFIQTV